MPFDAHVSRIRDLEEQVEYWRQRAEAAESALCQGEWDMPVRPLSLQQTRLMRLIAGMQYATSQRLAHHLGITSDAVKVVMCHCRKRLPECIAPIRNTYPNEPYTAPDLETLRDFLAGRVRVHKGAIINVQD